MEHKVPEITDAGWLPDFLANFRDNDERLAKYLELMMLHKEASPLAYQSRTSLGEVNVVLTTKCNLKCVWCHRNEEHLQSYLHREADFDKVAALLPQLEGFTTLHWAGLGEPLIYPRIYEISNLARRYFPKVKITTNGTLLKKENADQLIASGINFIEVSIDGFDGQTNQRFRGSSEDGAIEAMRYISENSDIEIQVNSVVAKDNYRALYEAADRLAGIDNIIEIHTIPIFMTKHMQEQGIREVDVDEHRELLEHLKARIQALGLDIRLRPDTIEAGIDPVIILKRKHNLCFTSFEAPYINVDGDLVPCGRLQHIALDNVFEKGFDEAWNGRRSLAWRRAQLKGNYSSYCQRECYMKNLAGGDGADWDREA